MVIERIRWVDSIRGIAILIVVLFHFSVHRPINYPNFVWGKHGVDLFFIISGFVMLHSLKNIKSSKQFLINRFSKLYPIYIFSIILISTIFYIIFLKSGVLFYNFTLKKFLFNLTMFQQMFNIQCFDNAHWTLKIDLFFYLMLFFIYYFGFMKYLVHIFLFLNIFLLFLFKYNLDFSLSLDFYFTIYQFLPLFLIGIILYNIYDDGKCYSYYYVLLVVVFLIQNYFSFKTGWNTPVQIFEYSIYPLILFAFIFMFLVGIHYSKYIENFNILSKIGDMSYVWYLIHLSIFVEILVPFLQISFHLNFGIASFLISLPTSFIVSYFIHRFIEIPLSLKLKSILNEKINF